MSRGRARGNPSIHLTFVPPWQRLCRKGMWTPRPLYSGRASVVKDFELFQEAPQNDRAPLLLMQPRSRSKEAQILEKSRT